MKIISWKNLTRLFVGFVLASLVCLLVTTVYFIQRRTYLEIHSTNARDNSTQLPFRQEDLSSHSRKNVRFLQNTQNIRSLKNFQTSVFAASDSGLLQFDQNGKLVKHFTVFDGLPESDLISLAVFQNKLFIGTRSRGLLSFDGKKFSDFKFTKHQTQAITALHPEPRELLIGTFNGGLISFDGKKFNEIKAPNNQRINKINNIAKIGEQIFVGTFDDGLWLINSQNDLKHFTKANGLLSDRVVGITKIDDEIFVGTDLGISKAELSGLIGLNQTGKKNFQTHKVIPSLSGLVTSDQKLLATKENGELFLFVVKKNNPPQKILWQNSEKLLSSSLFSLNEKIFLASNRGVFQISAVDKFNIRVVKFNDSDIDKKPAS